MMIRTHVDTVNYIVETDQKLRNSIESPILIPSVTSVELGNRFCYVKFSTVLSRSNFPYFLHFLKFIYSLIDICTITFF